LRRLTLRTKYIQLIEIIKNNENTVHHTYSFGPYFVIFYQTLMGLFNVCLRLLDSEESKIGILKNLNEILFNSQIFETVVKNWDGLSQNKSKILDFQISIKTGLLNLKA
jgi:hypothetical protein